jgi:NADH-quinone oxidoreductase subunit E
MKDPRASLLPVLQAVQHHLGYFPAETFVDIETQLGIPRQVSYSVASFYDDFRFDPPAERWIGRSDPPNRTEVVN